DLPVQLKPHDPQFQRRALNVDRHYLDFLVGARYQWRLSDRWDVVLRGDLSRGATDGTWSVSTMAVYRTDRGMWLFGYRHLQAKLGNDRLQAKISMSGPQIGYAFRF